jgi:hypothetical protein
MRGLGSFTTWAALSLAASPAFGEGAGEPVSEPATEVQVVGQRRPHATGFSRDEVRGLAGALDDPLRAIEPLPGVTPAVSGVPYFFVRGAPPGDVGYLFDGVRLPALFHALGGPSVIHPGLVESVELFAGPYPIEHSGFAGGVVVARAAEPRARAHAEAALRATDSSALVDAPLDAASNVSLAGRYAYANPILHLFAPDMSVAYWDYQARVERRLSSRTSVALRGFGAHDALTDVNDGKPRTLYGVDFHRLDLRIRRAFGRGGVSVQALGGWDRSLVRDGDVRVRDLSGSVRVDGSYALGRATTLQAGLRIGLDRYSLDLARLDDAEAAADYRRLYPARLDAVGGGYVGLELAPHPGLLVRPGMRVDLYTSRGREAVALDPRVSVEYRLSSRLSVYTGLGIAHQPPTSPVPTPGLTPTLGQGLQTGVQHSFGLRARLPAQVSLETTFFQSAIFALSDSIGQARARDSDASLQEDTRGIGASRGIEILLKRSLTRTLGGFVAYTLSRSERFIGRVSAPSAYDRRHVLSAALGYDWGHGFRSGARGSFYTGIPADVAYLEAARHPPRTTPYFRLDLRSEKRFTWGEAGYLSLVLEVVNATLNQEALRASCSAYACKERRIGPVTIPNLGIEAGF